VDLERKTYTVTEHLDLGYRPKDKEEGTLPIPDLLVNVLRNRRERYPRTRLIFPGQRGGANGHALRKQLGISKPLSPHVLRHSFAIWVVMGQKLDKSASRELRQRQRE
jgi:integrase